MYLKRVVPTEMWRIAYIKKNNNLATHNLAKEAILTIIDKIWIDGILNCVYRILTMELLPLLD
jgi:hypothetical protein